MKKKLLAALLSTAMVATLLTGCGSKEAEATAEAPAETEAPAEAEARSPQRHRQPQATCTLRSFPRDSSISTGRQY